MQAFCSSGLVVISCLLLLVAVLGLSGLAGTAHVTVLVPWVMKGIWSLTVHLWWLCRLSVLICSPPLPCAHFCTEGSPENLSLCHGLLERDERIVIATRWHMRSDLLTG